MPSFEIETFQGHMRRDVYACIVVGMRLVSASASRFRFLADVSAHVLATQDEAETGSPIVLSI